MKKYDGPVLNAEDLFVFIQVLQYFWQKEIIKN
jgi:hypothetical protein